MISKQVLLSYLPKVAMATTFLVLGVKQQQNRYVSQTKYIKHKH